MGEKGKKRGKEWERSKKGKKGKGKKEEEMGKKMIPSIEKAYCNKIGQCPTRGLTMPHFSTATPQEHAPTWTGCRFRLPERVVFIFDFKAHPQGMCGFSSQITFRRGSRISPSILTTPAPRILPEDKVA